MKASIVIELLTKGLGKAREVEKAIKATARAADGAERETAGLTRAETRLANAGNRAASGRDRATASLNRSSDAMRRARAETLALERQQDNLARKSNRTIVRRPNESHVSNIGGPSGVGGMGGIGTAFIGGLGMGVGGVAGAGMFAKASIQKSAELEFARDQLQVLGEYSDEQAKLYDKILKPAGAQRGVGTMGSYGVFGGLMAGGLDAGNAAKMTDDVMVFAKATQASTEDAAKTTVALQNNMKVSAGDMMKAFDSMALAGKEGQFEVRDMARSAPSIFARMGKLGEQGLQGVRGFAAMAQAIRATAGTSDEAATNFENMLDKFTAKDFTDKAQDFGINVQKVFADANKKGLSPVLELLKKIKTATGGDPFKLKELMPDVQSNAALSSLIDKIPELETAITRYGSSGGTVMRDFETATDNATEAWNRFSTAVANRATDAANKALPSLTKLMNAMSGLMETGNGEPLQIKAPDTATPEVKAAVASANENGARLNRWFEGLLGWEPSAASKALDGVDARADFHRRRVAGLRPDTGPADGSVSVRPGQTEGGTGASSDDLSVRPAQRNRDFDYLDKLGDDKPKPVQGPDRPVTWSEFLFGKADAKQALRIERDIPKSYADRYAVSQQHPSGGQLSGPEFPGGDRKLADGIRDSGRKAEIEAKATADAIAQTLSNIPLFSAGLKAGQQFAAGLTAAAPAVAAAANSALVAPVANRVPQSPAKIGPLRNLPVMGRKIAEQLAGGMASSDHPARAAGALAARIAINAEGESLMSAARRSAARMAQPAALRDTATSGPKSDTSGKGVAVSVGKIVLNGVKDMQEGVGRLGIELERAIAGTVGDVGAG